MLDALLPRSRSRSPLSSRLIHPSLGCRTHALTYTAAPPARTQKMHRRRRRRCAKCAMHFASSTRGPTFDREGGRRRSRSLARYISRFRLPTDKHTACATNSADPSHARRVIVILALQLKARGTNRRNSNRMTLRASNNSHMQIRKPNPTVYAEISIFCVPSIPKACIAKREKTPPLRMRVSPACAASSLPPTLERRRAVMAYL